MNEQETSIMQWGVVICASLAAAIMDMRTSRIPNVLTLPLLAGGMVFAYLQGGMRGAGESVAACIAIAAPFVLLFLFAGGGAGDAKLMGAIGAWLGWKDGIIALFCVCIAGVVLALGKAAIRGRLKLVLANVFVSVYTFIVFAASGRKRQQAGTESEPGSMRNSGRSDELIIPYGVAIFAGVCLAGGYVLLW